MNPIIDPLMAHALEERWPATSVTIMDCNPGDKLSLTATARWRHMALHWRAWQPWCGWKQQLHFPKDRFYSMGRCASRDILKMLGEGTGHSA